MISATSRPWAASRAAPTAAKPRSMATVRVSTTCTGTGDCWAAERAESAVPESAPLMCIEMISVAPSAAAAS